MASRRPLAVLNIGSGRQRSPVWRGPAHRPTTRPIRPFTPTAERRPTPAKPWATVPPWRWLWATPAGTVAAIDRLCFVKSTKTAKVASSVEMAVLAAYETGAHAHSANTAAGPKVQKVHRVVTPGLLNLLNLRTLASRSSRLRPSATATRHVANKLCLKSRRVPVPSGASFSGKEPWLMDFLTF